MSLLGWRMLEAIATRLEDVPGEPFDDVFLVTSCIWPKLGACLYFLVVWSNPAVFGFAWRARGA